MDHDEHVSHADNDTWIERAALLIHDDHVTGLGFGGIFCPSWGSLDPEGKTRWLKLARKISQIEGDYPQ